jgi:hypothetical protein
VRNSVPEYSRFGNFDECMAAGSAAQGLYMLEVIDCDRSSMFSLP